MPAPCGLSGETAENGKGDRQMQRRERGCGRDVERGDEDLSSGSVCSGAGRVSWEEGVHSEAWRAGMSTPEEKGGWGQ